MDDIVRHLARFINESEKIVVITGAGISTNAGIPDFRGPTGLYSRRDIPAETIFDIEYFKRDPSLFYTHIGDLWKSFENAQPTTAHRFLASLEQKGKMSLLVTQNIDGLHQKAGSRNVVSAHGDFTEFYCTTCLRKSAFIEPIREAVIHKMVPRCTCGGVMKPHVVFFGEGVIGMERSAEAVGGSDLLLVVGSSLVVFPVAYLPRYRKPGVPLVIINRGTTGFDDEAELKIDGDIDAVCENLIHIGIR